MAKQLWFTDDNPSIHRGNNDAKLNGVASWWKPFFLSEGRGSSPAAVAATATSVAGPTNGIEIMQPGSAALPCEWISEPLSADFTISGTITANIWAAEGSMNDNVATNVLVEKIDGATGALTQIIKTTNAVEAALSTFAAQNFTGTPTSTACKRGDRLRVRIFFDDAGVMGAGISGGDGIHFDRSTTGDGDSWIQFTENLTFETDSLTQTNGVTSSTLLGTPNSVAQSFVALSSRLTSVTLTISQASMTDNLIVEIQSDNAGSPSGTVIANVANIVGSTLPTVFTDTNFPCSIALTTGVTYHVVLRRSSAGGTLSYLFSDVTIAGWNVAKFSTGGAYSNRTGPLECKITFAVPNGSTYYLTDTAVTSYVEQTVTTAAAQIGAQTAELREAISFVADGTLTALQMWLNRVASPSDNLIIEVQTDSSGSPSGSVVGTITNVAASTFATTGTDYTFSCSIALTAGTTYWIVLRRSGAVDPTNFMTAATGTNVSWGVSKVFNGSTWSVLGGDLRCRITPAQNGTSVKAASTTRGSGSVNAPTATIAGPTTGVQVTTTPGGTTIEWYTPPLNAFTLGGKAKFNIRAYEGNATANASLKAEIAVTNTDGTGAVVWGTACIESDASGGELIASVDTAEVAWVAGDDLAVTAGKRLRFRIYVDDTAIGPLVGASNAVTVTYNGASAAAAGDTYVLLPASVTEQSTGPSTLFGVTSLAVTLSEVIQAQRKTFSQLAMPVAFTKDVAGQRKVFGQTATSITFAKDVAGQRKAFGQTATSITFSKDISGQRKTFGQTAASIVFSKDIRGYRKLFGQTATSITFSKDVSGQRKVFGQTATSITFSKDVSGSRKLFGQTVTSIAFSKDVRAQRKTFGQTATSISFAAFTTGNRPVVTQFGIVAAPFIFTKDVRGQRKTFGQTATPITFSKDVRGVRKTFGQIALPIIFAEGVIGTRHFFGMLSMPTLFGKETAAQRKTFGQTATPMVFSKDVNARRKTFGQTATPIIFSKDVSARRGTFGQTVTSIAFAATTSGVRLALTKFGITALPVIFGKDVQARRGVAAQLTFSITFAKDVRAQRKTFGQLLSPILFSKDVRAQRKTFGQTAMPLFLSIAATGRAGTTRFGIVALPIAFGEVTQGKRTAFGQIVVPVAFQKDVRGVRKTFAQIAFPIIFADQVLGTRHFFGQLAMPTLFGKEIAGRRKTFSQIASPFIFAKEVNGRKQSFARIALPINVLVNVVGFRSLGAQTYFGELSMPLAFSKQVSARRKTFGQIVDPFIFGVASQGQQRAISKSRLHIYFYIGIPSGQVGTHGVVDSDFIMTMDTNGELYYLTTILNDAQALRLGGQDVRAVYIGDELVWG